MKAMLLPITMMLFVSAAAFALPASAAVTCEYESGATTWVECDDVRCDFWHPAGVRAICDPGCGVDANHSGVLVDLWCGGANLVKCEGDATKRLKCETIDLGAPRLELDLR